MSSRINDVSDQAAGKAQKAQGESLATFLASLTTSGAILGLGIIVYMLLKWKYPEYQYVRLHFKEDYANVQPPTSTPDYRFKMEASPITSTDAPLANTGSQVETRVWIRKLPLRPILANYTKDFHFARTSNTAGASSVEHS